MKQFVMALTLCICSATVLTGCSGGGGDSVPFSALTSVDGNGTAAEFNAPSSVTTDGTNLYVADSGNHTIRKVVIATGVVTTLAGRSQASGFVDGTGSAARFFSPFGIKTDGTNLYVSDSYNNAIRKIVIETGEVTTLAGSAAGASGSDDGTGSAARFHLPEGLAITPDGTNLFVVDTASDTIRKIVVATGEVTTLAGSIGVSGTADGIGTAARFNAPEGITTDGTYLYVTDTNNNTIRKIEIETGQVVTFAGSTGISGSTDGTGVAAQFNSPSGITSDGTNLYVTDTGNHTVRMVVIETGVVRTLAGSPGVSGYVNDTGSAARFSSPFGVAVNDTDLYVADTKNNVIRVVVIASGTVTTLAGHAAP